MGFNLVVPVNVLVYVLELVLFLVIYAVARALTKYSLLSGAIIVFTRSVSETGATLAVVTALRTAPVILVDWVRQKGQVASLEIGLGCGFLILFSLIILLTLRFVVKEKGRGS